MQEMVGGVHLPSPPRRTTCKEDPQPGKKTLHGAHITGACANLDLAELVAPIRAAALPTARGSLPDARAKGKIAKQNSFNDLTSIEAHAMARSPWRARLITAFLPPLAEEVGAT